MSNVAFFIWMSDMIITSRAAPRPNGFIIKESFWRIYWKKKLISEKRINNVQNWLTDFIIKNWRGSVKGNKSMRAFLDFCLFLKLFWFSNFAKIQKMSSSSKINISFWRLFFRFHPLVSSYLMIPRPADYNMCYNLCVKLL